MIKILTLFLSIILLVLSSCVSTDEGKAGNVFIDNSKEFKLISGHFLKSEESSIQQMTEINVQFDSALSLSGKTAVVLVDLDNEALLNLASNCDRFAIRVHNRVFREETKYLYGTEFKDGFCIDSFPRKYLCPSELDNYPRIPQKNPPQFPSSIPDNFYYAMTSFLLFIDETGNTDQILPLHKAGSPFDDITLDYLNHLQFPIGEQNDRPVSYYQMVMVRYIKKGFRPYE